MEQTKLCEETLRKSFTSYLLKLLGKNDQLKIEFVFDIISDFINENYQNEQINDDEMSKIMKLFKDFFQNHFDLTLEKEEVNVIFHQLVINHCSFIKDIHHLNAVFKKHNE